MIVDLGNFLSDNKKVDDKFGQPKFIRFDFGTH